MNNRRYGRTGFRCLAVFGLAMWLPGDVGLAHQNSLSDPPIAPQPPRISYFLASAEEAVDQGATPETPIAPQPPESSYFPASSQGVVQTGTASPIAAQPPESSYLLASSQGVVQTGTASPIAAQPLDNSSVPANGQNLVQQTALPPAPAGPKPPESSNGPTSAAQPGPLPGPPAASPSANSYYPLANSQDTVPPAASPEPPTAPLSPAISDQDKFGTPPEDNTREFLRQESVLLKPCQWQFDVGLNYTIFDHRFTSIGEIKDVDGHVTDVVPIDSLQRRRLLVMPLQIRYGLSDRIQLFAALPVGWTNTEISAIGVDNLSNDGGLGDVAAGFSWLVHKSCGDYCDPDIVATFGCGAPTSKSDLYNAIFGSPQTTLGQGVWAGFWNVLFMHTYDPMVVFYGFGSWHGFARDFQGFSVQPGDQYTYRGGVGFAVNERITLSTMLYGYYITEARVNGARVLGTTQEPVYLRFAVTMLQRCHRICEPFAEIGMTTDAANARFGVTWTF